MNTFDAAKIFKVIVEQGSMVGAANMLQLSPSVVSKKLQQLESTIEQQLLKRTTRNIELTEAGQLFYERITALSDQWDSLITEVTDINAAPNGVLKICSPQPLSSRFITPIIHQFQEQHPNIRFEFIHIPYEQLPYVNADITICRKLAAFNSASFIGVPLMSYQNALYAAPDYLRSHPAISNIEDIKQHRLICYSANKSKYVWEFNNGKTLEIEPYIASNNTEVIIASAVNKLGIAYIPQLIIQPELRSNQLVSILPEYQSQLFETYLYYQKSAFVPAKVRVFIDYLRALIS